MPKPAVQVKFVHFEDFDGGELERLVFAYHSAHSARAELCRGLGHIPEARASYEKALALALARQEGHDGSLRCSFVNSPPQGVLPSILRARGERATFTVKLSEQRLSVYNEGS